MTLDSCGWTVNTRFQTRDKVTWQVTSCVIIVAVVLDKGRWGRNVAGLHGRHAGSSGNRRGLAV